VVFFRGSGVDVVPPVCVVGAEVDVPGVEVVVPVGSGACPDASACPITIVEPRGKPRWSASRWMTSPVTEPCHAETKPEPWLVLSLMIVMLPQSPSASERFGLGAIEEPSTNRFVIPESERSAEAPLAVTAARIDPTVISPPKSETSLTSVRAYAVPASSFESRLETDDPTETTDPSPGYAKPPLCAPPRLLPSGPVTETA
jgi:hypothetical protein